MPDDTGIAFVVTQHLSTARKSRMAGILKKHTGLEAVKGAGELIIAQDERQAEYDGMPGSAIKTGLVDLILPAEAFRYGCPVGKAAKLPVSRYLLISQ